MLVLGTKKEVSRYERKTSRIDYMELAGKAAVLCQSLHFIVNGVAGKVVKVAVRTARASIDPFSTRGIVGIPIGGSGGA
jgi:hypothetical protein